MMGKRKFLKNEKGATIIEFALVAPLFLLILTGLFELSMLLFILVTLESAVSEISRFGRTGDTIPGETQIETARRILTDRTFGVIDTSKVIFRITPVSDYGAADVSTALVDEIDFGGSSEPVIYTMTYPWTFMTPMVSTAAFGGMSTVPLSATAVVMNEPFAE